MERLIWKKIVMISMQVDKPRESARYRFKSRHRACDPGGCAATRAESVWADLRVAGVKKSLLKSRDYMF